MNKYDTIRRSGRTTRLADLYVQQLFLLGEINIKDHWGDSKHDNELFDIIKDRLKNEHKHLEYEILSKPLLTIKLKPY